MFGGCQVTESVALTGDVYSKTDKLCETISPSSENWKKQNPEIGKPGSRNTKRCWKSGWVRQEDTEWWSNLSSCHAAKPAALHCWSDNAQENSKQTDPTSAILQTCVQKSVVWNRATYPWFRRNAARWTRTWGYKPRPQTSPDSVVRVELSIHSESGVWCTEAF